MRPRRRDAAVLVAAACLGATLPHPSAGQRPDSVARLPDQTVTVTRSTAALAGLGLAVTIIDSSLLHRARVSPGLDEALAFVPGVITGNRWNYSVDQRLTVRGFGARANFGIRGVRLLVDGVPQTLPDGQSQLTNLDLGLVQRVEVLRGAASALYGNASGGVVAFTTSVVPAAPSEARIRFEGGSFGSLRAQAILAGRTSHAGGTISASVFSTDGPRQHSAARQRRFTAGVDWFPHDGTTVTIRAALADDPEAQNPGALTAAEVAVNRDSASAGNIRRGADKAVTQQQLAIGFHRSNGRWQLDAQTWGLARNLDNPLATPPPAPVTPEAGTWVGIDRVLGGARLSGSMRLGGLATAGPVVSAGVDLQSLRDDRVNRRSTGGVASDVVLLSQRETVTELGPFLQVAVPAGRFTVRGGLRRDATRFTVRDRLLTDGDASGARTMAATSYNAGLSYLPAAQVTIWTSIANAFETPTTTELANRPSGDGGFNTGLDPQRTTMVEVGARGTLHGAQLEVAGFHSRTRDAIVPYREVAGRTYFRNAGRTTTRGIEGGVTVPVTGHLDLRASATVLDARFDTYRVTDGTVTDTLDGNRLAGLPRFALHLGLRGDLGRHWLLDLDHATASSVLADDDNEQRIDGWGVTGVRIAWRGAIGGVSVAPFGAVLNLFDRAYVGSVTLNGASGRVLEPSAGRTFLIGGEIRLR